MTGPWCFQGYGGKAVNWRKFYCDHNRIWERNEREWMWDWDWGWNWSRNRGWNRGWNWGWNWG